MKTKLRSWHSPDIEINEYVPEEDDNFGFLLQTMIGPDDQLGTDTFDIMICTPKWLMWQHNLQNHDIYGKEVVFGRNHFIVFKYDFDFIIKTIEDYCNSIECETWDEAVEKLSRIGRWEFEDYKMYEGE